MKSMYRINCFFILFALAGGLLFAQPAQPAPDPTEPSANVISLFSNTYTNATVDTWSAAWDQADVADVQIGGNDTKLYTNLVFAGIEFTSQTIDASAMTYFHMDIWTPDPTALPAVFKIKLVDFGANGVWDGGGDDVEHEISIDANSSTPLATGQWVSLDIPLSAFTNLTTRAHLAQLIISGDPNTVYVDNVYFFVPTEPIMHAPTPTVPADSVISLFSNAYTNQTIDTWSAVWDQADVADIQVDGDDTKLYTNLVFAGIEFTSQTIDISEMNHFHMDIWTPDPTALPAVFKVKLVDFGANGVWDGGGDDVEHELTFDASTIPTLSSNQWVSLEVPLSDFTGLTSRSHLAQMIISGDPNTVYVDNIYFFYKYIPPTSPVVPAPTPTLKPQLVKSLFSDSYTNLPVDTWSAVWDQADLTDLQIEGNNTKLYENLTFAGIEFTSQTINIADMNFFKMDIWTPDPTFLPAVLKIKLVDFGANGVWGGGDDVEHEVSIDATTTPAIGSTRWISLDIPLSYFTGLTSRSHLAQIIISGTPNTLYFDNVLFYRTLDELPDLEGEPEVAAPMPTVSADSVISLYSNAYQNVLVDTWSAVWDVADLADIQIQGNDTKLYTNLVYCGIEFTTEPIDVTAMTHFHVDIWSPDINKATKAFKIKLVDFGANGVWSGGDDVEHEVTVGVSTRSEFSEGGWLSLDIPLTDFIGLVTKEHLAQLLFSGDLSTVYVDNVYFYIGEAGEENPTEPTVSAPVPTVPDDQVISLFSNAYTNVTVDTWSAEWDQANVSDFQVGDDDMKFYSGLVFAGIEFASQTIDATDMMYFHMDIWTPIPTDLPATFKIKLVDFGADGAYGGGDDVEYELAYDASTTPALVTGEWVSFDIPLSDFTGLTTRAHLAQLIISGELNLVYVDNVYLYSDVSGVDDGAVSFDFALNQNYPNPFNPSTVIEFSIAKQSPVTLKIFDVLGREVAKLVDNQLQPGAYKVNFDASKLASGIYFYRIEAGSFVEIKKMNLIK